MQVQSRWVIGLVCGLMLGAGSVAQAQSWKPTLHDADELYDAAEDLHDRAERFHDTRTMQVTYQLEHMTADLYQLLKRNACPTEVLPALNATGAMLEEASAMVSLSCQLRTDRKAQSELANAQRYFGATVERVQCALETALPNRPSYRAPAVRLPAPAPLYIEPAGSYPNVVPYGYEVRHYHEPAAPRGLPRVRIASVN